ncbi:DNA replication complex GINS protein PSF1 [Nakaseomyces bracarensis]|uniref:DNA replication complex GINS protein PSF1 n=1 Tax=Nakaseomyces bracarensis TaxID=273131 RepID=A0ABR4NMQ0_9SACH
MYGDLANKLVLEAKRTQQLNQRRINDDLQSGGGNQILERLPVYHDELVRNVLTEVDQLRRNAEFLRNNGHNEELAHLDEKIVKCQYFVTLLCMERNKRCLLAYQKLRADILDNVAWCNNGTGVDLHPGNTDDDNNALSQFEQEYLKEYSELITELKSGDLTDIDLSGSLEPPSDVFIDVRVLKDAGEIQTEYGVFNLIKDSQFFVRQSDVERLIQQGYLQKI